MYQSGLASQQIPTHFTVRKVLASFIPYQRKELLGGSKANSHANATGPNATGPRTRQPAICDRSRIMNYECHEVDDRRLETGHGLILLSAYWSGLAIQQIPTHFTVRKVLASFIPYQRKELSGGPKANGHANATGPNATGLRTRQVATGPLATGPRTRQVRMRQVRECDRSRQLDCDRPRERDRSEPDSS